MQQIGEDGVNETDRRNQDDEVKLKIREQLDNPKKSMQQLDNEIIKWL